MALEKGQTLSSYEILGALGAGAMGEVYLARDTQLEREVAIKVLPAHLASDEERLQRFEREAKMLAALNHPNVAQIFGVDQVEDLCFLVLEYVPGETLEERLLRGPLPIPEAMELCRQIAEGLEAAHERGVIHRDLKPANVRITPDGHVKLLDLGLAKPARSSTGRRDDDVLSTEEGRVMGTPAYMSPEQARGKPIDRRVDVWAFGCVLYECLTGTRAFGGSTLAEVMAQILEHEPDRAALPAELPSRVAEILDRCLEKDARQRLRDVGEARIALEAKGATTHSRFRAVDHAPRGGATRLIVLAFTDVVDSTGLKSRMGSAEYSRFVVWHDNAFRALIAAIPGAEILKDTGDGYMTRFPTASQAVEAALVFQKTMATGPYATVPVQLRVGLHMGEVSELGMDVHGKSKLVGLAADLTARVMSLALPGQTLMTQGVFDNARLYVREFPALLDATASSLGRPPSVISLELRWIAHGTYEFQGNREPVRVFEAGIEGMAPLRAPPDSEKAVRLVSEAEEQVLGWRPAVDLEIPGRPGWAVEQKLYSDEHAEVWVAKHKRTDERRTFKFCFDAERLRAFKRETRLFKILRDQLGDRPDIAKLYEVQSERPPFFLEVEYAPLGSLKAFCKTREGHRGLLEIPLGGRLDMMRRLAGAVAAAHSAGVLHKDIRPATILVFRDTAGAVHPKLADFGAGLLTRPDLVKSEDPTSWDASGGGMDSPVDLYTAPETLAGGEYTEKSDLYALGVLLFQMVVGDIDRPLTVGWESAVEDPLVREVVEACVQGRIEKRLGSADEMCRLLGSLEERRLEREREEREVRRARKRRKQLRLGAAVGLGAALLLGALFELYGVRRGYLDRVDASERKVEQAMSEARDAREATLASGDRARRALYFANLLAADTSLRDGDIRDAKEYLAACDPEERGWEWRHLSFRADASRLTLEGHEGPITSLALSPDGNRVASSARDGTLRLWDATSGECLHVLDQNDGPITAAAYGPDGQDLFTFGGEANNLRAWNASGGIESRARLTEDVFGLSGFSPDGERFAFCNEDNAVLIASRVTGRVLHRLPGQDDALHALTFDAAGERMLLCSHDGLVLSDIQQETAVTLDPDMGAAFAVAFDPTGEEWVAGFEDGTVRRFDASGHTVWSSAGHAGVVEAVAFSPDGTRVASGSLDKSVRLWDAANGAPLATWYGHEEAVRFLVFGRDGERLVSGGDDGALHVWDAGGFAAVRTWPGPEQEGWMTAVALDPSARLLLAGSGAGTVELWDAIDGGRILSLECEGGEVEAAAFRSDGRLLAVAFEQSFVKLWQLEPGSDGPARFTAHEKDTLWHEDSVTSVAFSPDGERLLISDFDAVHRWALGDLASDPAQLTRLEPLPGEANLVQCLAVSVEGARVAAGSGDGRIHVWTDESQPCRSLAPGGPARGVYSLAFDQRGARLLAGHEDGSLRLWDVESGALVRELSGHDGRVSGVAFGPDDRRVFSASFDSTVRVWDVDEARPILTLRGRREVYDLAMARDGSRLVSARFDNTIQAWESGGR